MLINKWIIKVPLNTWVWKYQCIREFIKVPMNTWIYKSIPITQLDTWIYKGTKEYYVYYKDQDLTPSDQKLQGN